MDLVLIWFAIVDLSLAPVLSSDQSEALLERATVSTSLPQMRAAELQKATLFLNHAALKLALPLASPQSQEAAMSDLTGSLHQLEAPLSPDTLSQ